jgi:hypothetical protein
LMERSDLHGTRVGHWLVIDELRVGLRSDIG